MASFPFYFLVFFWLLALHKHLIQKVPVCPPSHYISQTCICTWYGFQLRLGAVRTHFHPLPGVSVALGLFCMSAAQFGAGSRTRQYQRVWVWLPRAAVSAAKVLFLETDSQAQQSLTADQTTQLCAQGGMWGAATWLECSGMANVARPLFCRRNKQRGFK